MYALAHFWVLTLCLRVIFGQSCFSVRSFALTHPSPISFSLVCSFSLFLSVSLSSTPLLPCFLQPRAESLSVSIRFSSCKLPSFFCVCVWRACLITLCTYCTWMCRGAYIYACGCVCSQVNYRALPQISLTLLTYFLFRLPTAGAKWTHRIKCQPFHSLSCYYCIPL